MSDHTTLEVEAPCGCRRIRYPDSWVMLNHTKDFPCDAHIDGGGWLDVLDALEGARRFGDTVTVGGDRQPGIEERLAEVAKNQAKRQMRVLVETMKASVVERTCICGHRVDEHGEDGCTVKADKPDGTCECHRDPTSQGSSRIITVPTVEALALMLPSHVAEEMQGYADLGCGDDSHSGADELLCRLAEAWGYTDAARVFREMPRWTS